MKLDYSFVSDNTVLRTEMKVMNDTKSDNGLVHSRLVFSTVSQIPVTAPNLTKQKEGMEVLAGDWMEMNATVAERRVSTAFNKNYFSMQITHLELKIMHLCIQKTMTGGLVPS